MTVELLLPLGAATRIVGATSVNGALGRSGVLLAFVAALAGIGTIAAGIAGRRAGRIRTGRSYVWLVLLGAVVATFAMERALITHDFALQYVADNHSRATPLLFTIASMWGALEGSILLWGLVLAGYLAVLAVRTRSRGGEPMEGWATLVGLVVAAFFFGMMLGPADPFRPVAGAVPLDGPGPNPLLQDHPLMAFHPPVLYAGYVGFTIPFAYAVAALVTGRLDEQWSRATRRWTLTAWGFLTSGIILGAWWSYEVLGWGGYWAWDPVENASFLPWLTATAYIHSVQVQERRGMLRVWNLSLVLATFSLTILGTFLTRSGVVDSVHSFTESPIGPLLLGAFGVTVATVLGLIAWRGDQLRTPGTIDSPMSREGAFLGSNLLFSAFAAVVLLGTVFPLLAEALQGERLSVGRPYFDRMTTPIALATLFLMAIAPALPWRRATGEVLRDRMQVPAWIGAAAVVVAVATGHGGLAPLLGFGLAGVVAGTAGRALVLGVRRRGLRGLTGATGGGMIVHLGVAVLAVAFTASSSYAVRREVRLEEGQSVTVAGHVFRYEGVRRVEHPTRIATVADVVVDGRTHHPELSRYPSMTQAVGTPSVRTTLLDDAYVTLVASPRSPGASAVIGIVVSPLVSWLWVAGGIMAIGTALALVPQRRSGTGRRVPIGRGTGRGRDGGDPAGAGAVEPIEDGARPAPAEAADAVEPVGAAPEGDVVEVRS